MKEILGHSDIKTTMRYAYIEQQSVSRKATMVIDRFNGDGDSDWLRQLDNEVINYYYLINF